MTHDGIRPVSFLILLLTGGCSSLDPQQLPIDPPTVARFIGGTVAQIAFHELAHAAYAESAGMNYTSGIDGISYRYTYHTDRRGELARVIRMGYLADTVTAEAVPWVPRWPEKPFLNGLYLGSILDRGKAAIEGRGDVPVIADSGGPSEATLRSVLAASVAADLVRWRYPKNRWAVGVSAGLHGTLLVHFSRPF